MSATGHCFRRRFIILTATGHFSLLRLILLFLFLLVTSMPALLCSTLLLCLSVAVLLMVICQVNWTAAQKKYNTNQRPSFFCLYLSNGQASQPTLPILVPLFSSPCCFALLLLHWNDCSAHNWFFCCWLLLLPSSTHLKLFFFSYISWIVNHFHLQLLLAFTFLGFFAIFFTFLTHVRTKFISQHGRGIVSALRAGEWNKLITADLVGGNESWPLGRAAAALIFCFSLPRALGGVRCTFMIGGVGTLQRGHRFWLARRHAGAGLLRRRRALFLI